MNECILVVDDDREIVGAIAIVLEREGYTVRRAYDGLVAVEQALDPAVRLILIDVMMPKLDGLSALMRIREKRNLPVIVLSAKSEDTDKILGLSMGADDYVTKPYNLQILLARIARVLQRVYETKDSNHMKVGEVTMDISKSMLTYRGNSVDLTKNELRIMHCLFQNKNAIVSREKLMKHMWDCDAFVDDNTLTVNINRLRKKLEYIGLTEFIETKRGLGYIIYEDQ